MNDINNLMDRLHAAVAYRQFHDAITEGRMHASRQKAPLQESEPLKSASDPDRATDVLTETPADDAMPETSAPRAETFPATEPESPDSPTQPEIYVIEPRADPRIVEPPQGALTPGGSLLRRYGPAPEAAPALRAGSESPSPRTLPEIFALLEAKAR